MPGVAAPGTTTCTTEPERPPWFYTSDKERSKQTTEPERPPWFYTSEKARSKQPADFNMFVHRPGRNAPKNSGEQRKSIVRPVTPGQGGVAIGRGNQGRVLFATCPGAG